MDNMIEQEMEQETQPEVDQEPQATPADFQEIPPRPSAAAEALAAAAGGGEMPLSALYELMLPVTIELGRTRMSVQEVLQLARGSVIELDRLAGEPVDIYVGDRRFAEGEVVVLGENFGVRITRIFPPAGSGEAV